MIELVIPENILKTIKAEALNYTTEKCAILFATEAQLQSKKTRLLIRECQIPSEDDYSFKNPITAELKPEFVARITKKARLESYSIVFVHSHLSAIPPEFSKTDDKGESHLSKFLSKHIPNLMHTALLISVGGIKARVLGTKREIRVVSIGETLQVLYEPDTNNDYYPEIYDRQVRVFGKSAQKKLQKLKIAIVGLGGTGSLVAQQLAHLGIRDFILIDPDTLELSNLNRVVNATIESVGQPKVAIAQDYISSLANDSNIESIQGNIVDTDTAKHLIEADLIFSCTDSHGSRAVMQQISYQYLIPCIDMGVTIAVTEGIIKHIYGRVQLLSPGFACLTCSNLLSPNQVRVDMMSSFERQVDQYILGAREPEPAVISLNSTVASLAVTMFLSIVTGIPMNARHILYNAMSTNLRHVRVPAQTGCYICSLEGAFARGNSWPLFARDN